MGRRASNFERQLPPGYRYIYTYIYIYYLVLPISRSLTTCY